jgi:hypothetical protein
MNEREKKAQEEAEWFLQQAIKSLQFPLSPCVLAEHGEMHGVSWYWLRDAMWTAVRSGELEFTSDWCLTTKGSHDAL